MSDAIESFEIRIEDDVLEDLERRLTNARFPDAIEGVNWDYGTEAAYLKELCNYWRDEFDWRAQERLLNRFSHYRTEIDSQPIHFIHARSEIEDAVPLLLIHGWPGSIFEFYKVIEPLRDPVSHGGSADDAFHVVCPSIPGYGFSGPTRETGWDILRVAKANATLMARLGYTHYGAQGGDWGALAATLLGHIDSDHLSGIHVNMVVSRPPQNRRDIHAGLSDDELRGLMDARHFRERETGYQEIQGTKPQTLGYALNDSPVGLAAWIVEKFRTWSDCDGDVESVYSKDELLTNITIYWVTQTINASMRLYFESKKSGTWAPPAGRVQVPTGCAVFPKELFRPPRSWADQSYNVAQWTVMPRGGHFAAMEVPELLVEDIRSLFRELR